MKMKGIFATCLLVVVALSTTSADYVNYTIHVNDIFGYPIHRRMFGPAHTCPEGKGVTGFRLRLKDDENENNRKITGVEMICQDGTKLGPETVRDDGAWGDWKYCDGTETKYSPNFAIAFNYRSVERHGGRQLKMKCTNDNGAKELGPVGFDDGEWGVPGYSGCSTSTKFCGFAAEYGDKGIGRMKFLCCSRAANTLLGAGDWVPYGQDICIGGKDEDYGFFRMPQSGFLKAMKFVHIDGMLSCNANDANHESRFGCNTRSVKRAFSIFVTTQNNENILPDSNQRTPSNDKFYMVLGHDARKADEFTLLAANPTYINEDDEVRVWYGEDLRNHGDQDNGEGKTCVNVFGKLL